MTEELVAYEGEWTDGAARDWAERAAKDVEELDAAHLKNYGIARTTLYGWFLRDLPKDIKILEVGASTGLQLLCLQGLGFTDLEGCDISPDVVELCPFPCRVADIRDLPYDDNSFGLVLTSGTLMHVPFPDKQQAFYELARVSRRYVFGFEYQSYGQITQPYTMMPDSYLHPIERMWRLIAPEAVIMRADTWRGPPFHNVYAYLLDLAPLSPEMV